MKKSFVVLVLSLLVSGSSLAQFYPPDAGQVREVSQRQIVVIASDKEPCRGFNTLTERLVKQYWKFTPHFIFKTPAQATALTTEHPELYAVLSWYFTDRTFPDSHTLSDVNVFVLGLRLPDAENDMVTVSEVAFPDDNLAAGDVAFAIQQMQIDLEAGLFHLTEDDPAYWDNNRLAELVKDQPVFVAQPSVENEEETWLPVQVNYAEKQFFNHKQSVKASLGFYLTTIFSDRYFTKVRVLVRLQDAQPVLYLLPRPDFPQTAMLR